MHIRRFPMRAVLEHMCETFSVVKVPTLLVHDAGSAGILDFDAGTVSYRSDLPIEQIVRTLAHVISHWQDCEAGTLGWTAEEELSCNECALHHKESLALYMTLHGDRWIEEFRGK